VTNPQLNKVDTPTWNNARTQVPSSFEVFRTPLVDFPICGIQLIEMSGVVTSPQLNQVNAPTWYNGISQVPPSFEVSRAPLVDSPICGTIAIEMF